MKKLIFAAAAVAGMGAFALESANVVGFQDVEAPQGSSMRTATFQTVSGEGYDLTKIVVNGSEGMGDVVAQTISSAGLWNGEYYYLTDAGAGVPDGWYKDGVGEAAVEEGEVVLAPGAAFSLYSDYNPLALNVAGEVKQGAYTVEFAQGNGMVGNGTPVEVDLTAITVEGSEGMGDVIAQTISAEGLWDGEYYYLTEDGAGVPTGWYKDGVGEVAVEEGEVILAPGAAFSLYSDYNALTITLPAAL